VFLDRIEYVFFLFRLFNKVERKRALDVLYLLHLVLHGATAHARKNERRQQKPLHV